MLSFHVTIHVRPPGDAPGPVVELHGASVATRTVPRELLATTTFERTFEAVSQDLAALDRMYCEPDGSFVWVSSQGTSTWQLDGNLYDRAERLLFVDLKGTCPADEFDRLLTTLGWPQTQLLFQLTREAVFLDETEFRNYASTLHS